MNNESNVIAFPSEHVRMWAKYSSEARSGAAGMGVPSHAVEWVLADMKPRMDAIFGTMDGYDVHYSLSDGAACHKDEIESAMRSALLVAGEYFGRQLYAAIAQIQELEAQLYAAKFR